MNMTRDRVQSIAWAFTLAFGFAMLMALTFRVNAVKSQVRLTERHIVALRQEKLFLETEFQTRANQQQLSAINDVEFGYKAPLAIQYVDGERQLAALVRPVAPQAPAPVLMASADTRAPGGSLPAMFALAGKALTPEPATRMLAQHGEKVAPGGHDKFMRQFGDVASGRGDADKAVRLSEPASAARRSKPDFAARFATAGLTTPDADAKAVHRDKAGLGIAGDKPKAREKALAVPKPSGAKARVALGDKASRPVARTGHE